MDTGRGVSSQEALSSSSYERTSGLASAVGHASAVHTCTPTQLAVALATFPLPAFVKGGQGGRTAGCVTTDHVYESWVV
jgi:hypothetical protein